MKFGWLMPTATTRGKGVSTVSRGCGPASMQGANVNTCLYRTIHPPTGVTHAVSGFFTHTPAADPTPNLIVARTTEFDVYRVIRCGSLSDEASL
jgi:hypothetical protein